MGGEVEFDVYTKRGVDDDVTFLSVASPTPAAQGGAAEDRNKLLRYTMHARTQGTHPCACMRCRRPVVSRLVVRVNAWSFSAYFRVILRVCVCVCVSVCDCRPVRGPERGHALCAHPRQQ